jgi:hypothetical protein
MKFNLHIQVGLSIFVPPAYSSDLPEDDFQSSTRIAYSRILLLSLKICCFQRFQQFLGGMFP